MDIEISRVCEGYIDSKLVSRGTKRQLPRHDVGGQPQSEGLKRATNLTLNFGVEAGVDRHFFSQANCKMKCKWVELNSIYPKMA